MLKHLQISHFVLIKHLDIELSPGLIIITGETGAGKSLILEAIKLLTGSRANGKLVFNGMNQAELIGEFSIGNQPDLTNFLKSQDYFHQD